MQARGYASTLATSGHHSSFMQRKKKAAPFPYSLLASSKPREESGPVSGSHYTAAHDTLGTHSLTTILTTYHICGFLGIRGTFLGVPNDKD